MTTVGQIQTIYKELEEVGVTDILSFYKGWQKGGVYSLPVADYKADSKIGGTKALTELIEETKDTNIDFYLHTDGLRANPDTGNTTFHVVKKIDKRLYQEETYQEVYETMKFLTPTRSKTLLNQLTKEMKQKGIEKLALNGVGNTLFTWTYNGKSHMRSDTLQEYDLMFSELKQNTDLILDEPFAPYWKYIDGITDMPVSDSDYIFTDKSIPFLSIALKGVMPMYADYTNFEADKQKFFLKLVETGIYPSFYLTWEDPSELINTNSNFLYTSKYSTYKKEIQEYYDELKSLNDKVANATIEDHKTNGDLVVVTYSNGTKVYVNYGEKQVEEDGERIPALSYKVGDTE